MKIVVSILLLIVMVVQAQFISDYTVHPALHTWFSEQKGLYQTTVDYVSYPDQTAADYREIIPDMADPWTYSFNPISKEVQQVPFIFAALRGFLVGSKNVPDVATPVRTKRKNVFHYRNDEFRPTLCSPRLCLVERPVGESDE